MRDRKKLVYCCSDCLKETHLSSRSCSGGVNLNLDIQQSLIPDDNANNCASLVRGHSIMLVVIFMSQMRPNLTYLGFLLDQPTGLGQAEKRFGRCTLPGSEPLAGYCDHLCPVKRATVHNFPISFPTYLRP